MVGQSAPYTGTFQNEDSHCYISLSQSCNNEPCISFDVISCSDIIYFVHLCDVIYMSVILIIWNSWSSSRLCMRLFLNKNTPDTAITQLRKRTSKDTVKITTVGHPTFDWPNAHLFSHKSLSIPVCCSIASCHALCGYNIAWILSCVYISDWQHKAEFGSLSCKQVYCPVAPMFCTVEMRVHQHMSDDPDPSADGASVFSHWCC